MCVIYLEFALQEVFMRQILSVSLFSLLATGALAGTFTLDSEVSAVTIYPAGATITRSMAFDLPAGRHTLVISDIPYEIFKESLRVFAPDSLALGATQIERTRIQPDVLLLEQREQLEARIESLEAQILASQEESAGVGLLISAANARIKLLETIGTQQAQGAASALENQTASVETITALVSLVGSETLSALQEAQAARVEMARINRAQQELQTALREAQEELGQLVEPSDWQDVITLDVEVGAETSGSLSVSYTHPGGEEGAGWKPVYDFHLDSDQQSLKIDRNAMVMQATGEDWENAEITLSTALPFSFESFEKPYGNRASYAPPPPPPQPLMMRSDAGTTFVAPEVVAIEEPSAMGVPNFVMQGITATYLLPTGTQLPSSFEPVQITINSASFDVEISAQANMLARTPTAFVIADFTNTSEEPYLPGQASYFRDGAFVRGGDWNDEIDLIAAGASAELEFGRINGLLLERNTLRREDGSSGVITTSNDRVEEYELSIENVSNRAWDVVIYDRVPYSEQEELVIDWSARPRPSNTDIEGQRGVMAWAFPLASGAHQNILLSYQLEWPEGNELQMR